MLALDLFLLLCLPRTSFNSCIVNSYCPVALLITLSTHEALDVLKKLAFRHKLSPSILDHNLRLWSSMDGDTSGVKRAREQTVNSLGLGLGTWELELMWLCMPRHKNFEINKQTELEISPLP